MAERKRALLSAERKATIAKAISWIGGSLTLPGLPEDKREGEAPADPASYLSLAYKEFWQGILANPTTKKLYA